jgi:hypothetical protein
LEAMRKGYESGSQVELYLQEDLKDLHWASYQKTKDSVLMSLGILGLDMQSDRSSIPVFIKLNWPEKSQKGNSFCGLLGVFLYNIKNRDKLKRGLRGESQPIKLILKNKKWFQPSWN